MDSQIPLLDLYKYSLNIDKSSITSNEKESLARQVVEKFEQVGFCYVSNHGISSDFIQEFMDICRRFFELPISDKSLYGRESKEGYHGWIGIGEEVLDRKRPGDLKETFNYHPGQSPESWPQVIPEFKSMNDKMFSYCTDLVSRLCELLAIGLGVQTNYFSDKHQHIGLINNGTALRSLYYPALGSNSDVQPGQVRLGEHSDYGTITNLFQDNDGGLEVKTTDRGFIPATPIPGTVLVNIGDMLQRMTSDRLIATRHRVNIPESEIVRKCPRQSVAFFLLPDDDVMIECLDGSDKYDPIKAVDYLNFNISQAYAD